MLHRRKGFTLIELLVVIAIIAILAAILFPVFAKAREKANQASCQSNEKQLALSLAMYIQDYDEVYPYAWFYTYTGVPNNGVWGTWGGLDPYIKNKQIFTCPSRPNVAVGYVTDRCRFKWTVMEAATYPGCKPNLTASRIKRPAEIVTWFETNTGTNACCLNYMSYVHNEGENVAYADGHVKWVRGAGGTYGAADIGTLFRAKYLISPWTDTLGGTGGDNSTP